MDYCISDIHGYYDLFRRLLGKIRFSGGARLKIVINTVRTRFWTASRGALLSILVSIII